MEAAILSQDFLHCSHFQHVNATIGLVSSSTALCLPYNYFNLFNDNTDMFYVKSQSLIQNMFCISSGVRSRIRAMYTQFTVRIRIRVSNDVVLSTSI